MTFLGVPILDWVILGGLLVLGVEAWVTCRPSKRRPPTADDTPALRPVEPPDP